MARSYIVRECVVKSIAQSEWNLRGCDRFSAQNQLSGGVRWRAEKEKGPAAAESGAVGPDLRNRGRLELEDHTGLGLDVVLVRTCEVREEIVHLNQLDGPVVAEVHIQAEASLHDEPALGERAAVG